MKATGEFSSAPPPYHLPKMGSICHLNTPLFSSDCKAGGMMVGKDAEHSRDCQARPPA